MLAWQGAYVVSTIFFSNIKVTLLINIDFLRVHSHNHSRRHFLTLKKIIRRNTTASTRTFRCTDPYIYIDRTATKRRTAFTPHTDLVCNRKILSIKIYVFSKMLYLGKSFFTYGGWSKKHLFSAKQSEPVMIRPCITLLDGSIL